MYHIFRVVYAKRMHLGNRTNFCKYTTIFRNNSITKCSHFFLDKELNCWRITYIIGNKFVWIYINATHVCSILEQSRSINEYRSKNISYNKFNLPQIKCCLWRVLRLKAFTWFARMKVRYGLGILNNNLLKIIATF